MVYIHMYSEQRQQCSRQLWNSTVQLGEVATQMGVLLAWESWHCGYTWHGEEMQRYINMYMYVVDIHVHVHVHCTCTQAQSLLNGMKFEKSLVG